MSVYAGFLITPNCTQTPPPLCGSFLSPSCTPSLAAGLQGHDDRSAAYAGFFVTRMCATIPARLRTQRDFRAMAQPEQTALLHVLVRFGVGSEQVWRDCPSRASAGCECCRLIRDTSVNAGSPVMHRLRSLAAKASPAHEGYNTLGGSPVIHRCISFACRVNFS